MFQIPEEFKYKTPRNVPIDSLQQEYKAAYNKYLSNDLIEVIDKIEIIAGFNAGNNTEERFNGIVFIEIVLKKLIRNTDLAEIAKSIFRTIRKQCFLIFHFPFEEKYSTSSFYINKLDNNNNSVIDLVISENFTVSEQNEKKRRQINRIEKEIKKAQETKDNAQNIYKQLYTILLDNCEYKMEWSSEYNIPELYKCDYVENDTFEEEKDYIVQDNHNQKALQEEKEKYDELRQKAENDLTGEYLYQFANIHKLGLHYNPQKYAYYLKLSSEKKYVPAMYDLAKYYETGYIYNKLIKKDPLEAFKLYSLLKDSEHARGAIEEWLKQMENKGCIN